MLVSTKELCGRVDRIVWLRFIVKDNIHTIFCMQFGANWQTSLWPLFVVYISFVRFLQ